MLDSAILVEIESYEANILKVIAQPVCTTLILHLGIGDGMLDSRRRLYLLHRRLVRALPSRRPKRPNEGLPGSTSFGLTRVVKSVQPGGL